MPGNDAFEIPTRPIAPGHDAGPRLVVVLLVAAMAGAFVIARWSSDHSPDRSVPTVGPTEQVAEIQPAATAPPLLQWFTAPEAPLDDVFVEAGQVRRLRLATARITDDPLAQPGRDLLLPAARGGTICLCWRPATDGQVDQAALDIVRLDGDDQQVERTTIAAVHGLDLASPDAGPTTVALEPSPDGHFAYLAMAGRTANAWQVTLDVIDLVDQAIVDTIDVATEPDVVDSGARLDVSSVVRLAVPTLRVAPDGRHVLVSTAVSRRRLIGQTITSRAWVVDLGDADARDVQEADAIMSADGLVCDWVDFATDDLIATACRGPAGAMRQASSLLRYDLERGDLGPFEVEPFGEDADPLIDATRGLIYAWDAEALAMRVIDVAKGVELRADTAGAESDAPAGVVVIGPRPTDGSPTAWSDGQAATASRPERSVVGSPDGRLLYATGAAPDGTGSSGVWVFDTQSLRLVERWPALATYDSLALLEDGRWLAALGRPGVTPQGAPAEWGTSLTVHDALSGRPVLRIGDLRTDGQVTFAWNEPPAALD